MIQMHERTPDPLQSFHITVKQGRVGKSKTFSIKSDQDLKEVFPLIKNAVKGASVNTQQSPSKNQADEGLSEEAHDDTHQDAPTSGGVNTNCSSIQTDHANDLADGTGDHETVAA